MAILAATKPPTIPPSNRGTTINTIFDNNNSKLSRPSNVETIATNIPVIPKIFPVRDVSGEDRPLKERIKNIPEIRYKAATVFIDNIYFFLPFLYIASILIVTRKPPKIFIDARNTANAPVYSEI